MYEMEIFRIKFKTLLYNYYIGPSIILYKIIVNGFEARVLLCFIQRDYINTIFHLDIYLDYFKINYIFALIFQQIFTMIVSSIQF